MSRLSQSSRVGAGVAVVAIALLLACPPADQQGGRDSTPAGTGDEIRYPVAVASIPVLREPTDLRRRADCFSHNFVNGSSANVGGGRVRIAAHDSTVQYDLTTLEKGEHFIAAMYDEGGAGLEEYALAPRDSVCWAVRADSIGLHSVFYGAEETVLRPLTVDVHPRPHDRAYAEWVREVRYPASFRQFETDGAEAVSTSWVPPFIAPGVAFASVAAARDTTDQGGSGPWTVCAAYGCCKPR